MNKGSNLLRYRVIKGLYNYISVHFLTAPSLYTAVHCSPAPDAPTNVSVCVCVCVCVYVHFCVHTCTNIGQLLLVKHTSSLQLSTVVIPQLLLQMADAVSLVQLLDLQ